MAETAVNMEFKSGYSWSQAEDLAHKMGAAAIPTICGMCGPAANCGIYAFVKNGRFVNVAGMQESPVNHGGLCAKAHGAPQWVYSRDRLTHPLKRIGQKGEGRFEAITWDEALDIIADTLLKQKVRYGPESFASLVPAKRTYNDFIYRLLVAHGSPNYGHSGICAMQRAFAFKHTIGDWPQPEYDNSDMIIYWGRQPIFSGPPMNASRALVSARSRGARLITIKPSAEPDTGFADQWLAIRPGTDTALALAMLHVVVEENLIDQAFVDQWCYGYEHLPPHLTSYSPVWAETITGVPAVMIEGLAREYAATPKAAIDLGNGVEHAPSANDTIRAVAILMAVTGHLDRPGCNLFSSALGRLPDDAPDMYLRPKNANLRGRYTQEWVDKLLGPEFPKAFQPFLGGTSSAYYRLFESVLSEKPYPVRTLLAPGTQALASTRGSRYVAEALKRLEFFVVVDVARTADMAFADIVLPTTTPYECDHPFECTANWLVARNRVVEPTGSFGSIYEFILALGVRLGYGADFWNGDMQACMNDLLEPMHMTIDELRSRPNGVILPTPPVRYEKYAACFNAKSQRLDNGLFLPQAKVAIYNTSFEQAGFHPLPHWREPPESLTGTPQLTTDYPLILSDYHTSKFYTASWLRNVPRLREMEPHPLLHIHPDTSAARGIDSGDTVVVQSPHGSIKVIAEVYPGIRPDTVMLLHGWWQGCRELGVPDFSLLDGGANVNVMYGVDRQKAYDPLITAMSSQTLVQVRKV